jgi:hypothetical protein
MVERALLSVVVAGKTDSFTFRPEKYATKLSPGRTMKTQHLDCLATIIICTVTLGLPICAAPVPYIEDFDSYAVGDTPVRNFTEVDSTKWTIVAPSFSGQAYQNDISVFSPGPGFVAAENSSAVVNFPRLASSGFLIAASFVVDELILDGDDPSNTANIGLVARGADSMPASSGGDRYQVSYFLDDDDLGHPTGKLYLTEHNLFFGDSLNALSVGTLPIVIGHLYMITLEGRTSGSSLLLKARLTDTNIATSIGVSATDDANILGGSFFGYFNNVRVKDGGTVAVNADFDDFSSRRRGP